jgi:uncharacterized protein (DUF362 family)
MATPPENSVVGVVQSSHAELSGPVSIDQSLTYEQVKEMVSLAIEYGHPKSGGLGTIIPQNAWVVIKPNIVFIKPQGGWRVGDTTDLRVVKAVFEYVAEHSFAQRITLAEGGSYRGLGDNRSGDQVYQDEKRVDAYTVDWGAVDYPGFTGTVQGMLEELSVHYPEKQFDYVDLNYDVVRDGNDDPVAYEVPISETGVGAISPRTEYYVTNTIVNCDVLISVPVMKTHGNAGMTAVFKNYIGTAPREMYAGSGWWNANLHNWHSIDGNIDPAICDLAAFHPPDFAVVDGIRGLQYTEHNNGRADQMIRRNVILAGEDPVAVDAMVSEVMGYTPGDMNYLLFAAARGMGTFDPHFITVRGDPIDEVAYSWIKAPSNENYGLSFYYGRGNHVWLLNGVYQGDLDTDFIDGEAQVRPEAGEWAGGEAWDTKILFADKLNLKQYVSEKYGNYDLLQGAVTYAATYAYSEVAQPAYLWVGVDNGIVGYLNGEEVLREYNSGGHRFAQYRVKVDLSEGENVLVFKVANDYGDYALSVALVDMDNDGDTVPGIWWSTKPYEVVAVEQGTAWTRPGDFVLEPNYPNPFNASTNLRYALPRESRIELAVYDLLGRRVRTIADGVQPAGWHTARWDGRDEAGRSVASGLYIYTLSAQTDQRLVEIGTGKLMLLR